MDLSERYTRRSLNRVAISATAHCLAGCSIGEVLGMEIGTALGLSTWSNVRHFRRDGSGAHRSVVPGKVKA